MNDDEDSFDSWQENHFESCTPSDDPSSAQDDTVNFCNFIVRRLCDHDIFFVIKLLFEFSLPLV